MSQIKIMKHESDLLSFKILDKIYTVSFDGEYKKDIPCVCFSAKFENNNDEVEIFKFDHELRRKLKCLKYTM